MRFLKRRTRLALIALGGILFTVLCIEHLSYLHNTTYWPEIDKSKEDVLRILFVADPQIQGEEMEHFLYGWVTRWDADKYLQKNYRLAKNHVLPHVVVFLGDLFDEGSIASDPAYRRYFSRFRKIFSLPKRQDSSPSSIKYVFVPGDNDVGGERSEPVNDIKVNWFAKLFGDFKSVDNVDRSGIDVQFIKMNLFMPEQYKNPLKGFENVINGTKKPDIRIIVSHVSLLSYMTNSVEKVVEGFRPNLIISAHSHSSAYMRYTPGTSNQSPRIIHDFLLPSRKGTNKLDHDHEDLYTKSPFTLDLKSVSSELHEILVPTCSYRMGVSNMGYGAMELYRDGTMKYTVLWLPSRFKQLFLYAAVYILMKIILTPFLCWKLGTFVCRKIKEMRVLDSAKQYIAIA
ncbi:Metallophosphoesterase 1 [Orchesella cincta]|uniref:Metallophosphoesterase 1 n=1 Tax=Orchesella cincta TaxID=48709 RepID=A0A1D2NM48_ORCCI|nr:Metallophosphoesterase 1 [Orchesella cincta]